MSSTSRSRKSLKLKKISFISPLSLNSSNLSNFLPPKRINTSTTHSTNPSHPSFHHKRNTSRETSTHPHNYINYSYTHITPSSKNSCYIKSYHNTNNNIRYNTSRGLSASTSYRNATPQHQTHKQLTRSSSTAQQLLNKRKVIKKGCSNIKVVNCVVNKQSQVDMKRLNTQNYYSNGRVMLGLCGMSNTKTKESSSSQNSNYNTTSSKGSKRVKRGEGGKMRIETPEDLHFFYVHFIQSGKQYENKF